MALLTDDAWVTMPPEPFEYQGREAIAAFLGQGFASRWQHQEIDLKKGGAVPIANLARFHALANGISISSTLDRLTATEGLGAISKETAQSLREAFEVIYQVRIEHQAEQTRARLKPDNLIRPEVLQPAARAELREAFNAIGRAQQQLYTYTRLGI